MAFRARQPPQDEKELEMMAEAELARLNRQYRIMEKDRAAYAQQAKLQLRKQEKMIDQLEAEKAELLLGLGVANSKSNVKKHKALVKEMKCLLAQREKYRETIKNEKQQMKEVREQITKVSREVDRLRKTVPTEAQSRELAKKQERTVEILENRLEVATKRFNVIVADNQRYREEITSLLKERKQFNTQWQKLVKELDAGKQVIDDLIEQATATYNTRDEELNKIHALQERGAKDLKAHTSEMCELQRTLDNECKLQEFLSIKGQHRDMGDLNLKKSAVEQAKQEDMEKTVDEYTQILQQIKEFTGEEDIDRLMAHFVKQEEENFALFSYVNELNDEVEGLQARVSQLRNAIDEARALNAQRSEQQTQTREKVLKQLEEETKSADEAEKTLAEYNEMLDKVLRGVETLFRAIKCDNSPILELLGDNTRVSANNVMLYLGIIERRFMDVLNKVYMADKAKKSQNRLDETKKPRLKVPALTNIAPTQPCALCVEKEEMHSVSEGLDLPLTREEAISRLERRLGDDHLEILHNVSGCHLPGARKIMHKRYQ